MRAGWYDFDSVGEGMPFKLASVNSDCSQFPSRHYCPAEKCPCPKQLLRRSRLSRSEPCVDRRFCIFYHDVSQTKRPTPLNLPTDHRLRSLSSEPLPQMKRLSRLLEPSSSQAKDVGWEVLGDLINLLDIARVSLAGLPIEGAVGGLTELLRAFEVSKRDEC
jgi:hypothetical protein